MTTSHGRYALSGKVPRLVNVRARGYISRGFRCPHHPPPAIYPTPTTTYGTRPWDFSSMVGGWKTRVGEPKLRRTQPDVLSDPCLCAPLKYIYPTRPPPLSLALSLYVLHMYYTYYFNHDLQPRGVAGSTSIQARPLPSFFSTLQPCIFLLRT